MRKMLIGFVAMLCCCIATFGQTMDVSGKVIDSAGAGIPNVSIKEKGARNGVSASIDGSFRIRVKTGAILAITGVGYQPKDVVASSNLTISLTSAKANTLDEVVVVAYGTQKKTNLTGSISTVKGGEVADKPFSSVDKALQGEVVGLQSSSSSGAPGSATSIVIRGIGSINASSSPLWVIDGVIASTGDFTVNTTTANVLSSINPDDIESISVLKDASASSVYGSRAANGVILVTTKRGKAGKTRINFSSEVGQNSLAFKPSNKPLTTTQYQTVLREGLINAGYATDNASADALITDPVNGLGIDPNYTSTNTNWLDQVTRKGNQGQYNLSLNGGNENTQYTASAGYFNQDGTTIATTFKRYNGAFSITNKVNDRLTFSANLNGSSSSQSTPANGGAFANPVLSQFFLLPFYSPYNTDGSLRYNDSLNEFPLSGGVFNPVVQAAYNSATALQVTLRGSVSGEYKILKNLKFTSRYSAEYFDIQEDAYLNPFYGDGYADNGDAYASNTRVFDYTFTNFADFRQNLNANKDVYFDVKAGYEAQEYKYYTLQANGASFPGTLQLQYLASAASPKGAYSLPSANSTNSFFSTGDINYKDKYVVSGSFRRDGSSVFGANHKYGNFYSVGVTWNVTEEDFMKDVKFISLLKLRSSYGENGNSLGFGNYAALPTYGYGYNYTGNPGSAPNNIGNPNLTWEKNKPFNVGVDFGILKDRINGTVEYYNRTTSDLLANTTLSPTSGFAGGQLSNVGSLENKGIEITLNIKPVVTKDFTWSLSFNFAHNKNTVKSLYNNAPIITGQFAYTVGHDLQEFYLRQWAGVDPAKGTPLWYTDGTHTTQTSTFASASLALSGKSAAPKYFGGLTNTFTYKGFSLSAQIYYNYGNYISDPWGSYTSSEGVYLGSFNQLSQELSAWQKPGDVTNVPQIIFGGNNNSYRTSTRFLYKDDYVRLRDAQLSYALPTRLLKGAKINNITVYVRGTNLLTFVKDKNLPFDPEGGINYNTNTNAGLQVYIPKTISGGIKIGL